MGGGGGGEGGGGGGGGGGRGGDGGMCYLRVQIDELFIIFTNPPKIWL